MKINSNGVFTLIQQLETKSLKFWGKFRPSLGASACKIFAQTSKSDLHPEYGNWAVASSISDNPWIVGNKVIQKHFTNIFLTFFYVPPNLNSKCQRAHRTCLALGRCAQAKGKLRNQLRVFGLENLQDGLKYQNRTAWSAHLNQPKYSKVWLKNQIISRT